VVDTVGRANSFVGTAEYVSPELLTDKVAGKPYALSPCSAICACPALTPCSKERLAHARRADIWALGCIIYQMLAGKPPFKGPNEYQTFQRITKLEYQFPPGFPDTAKDLVRKMLVRAPSWTLEEAEKKPLTETRTRFGSSTVGRC